MECYLWLFQQDRFFAVTLFIFELIVSAKAFIYI
jgi:hypothetical protein